MRKFSLIVESLFEFDHDLLNSKISDLGKWLVNDLGMRDIIDNFLSPYSSPPSERIINEFDMVSDILKESSMDPGFISSKRRLVLNTKFVLDESGKWHPVNKLNTNYSDISDLLTELIWLGYKNNRDKGIIVYNSILKNPKDGLLFLKPYLPKLIDKYFDVENVKKFTRNILRNTKIGDSVESYIKTNLTKNDFKLLYVGEEGSLVDMLLGCDIICERDDFGVKTIQVKSKINWDTMSYYKVDWIADRSGIYDIKTKRKINI